MYKLTKVTKHRKHKVTRAWGRSGVTLQSGMRTLASEWFIVRGLSLLLRLMPIHCDQPDLYADLRQFMNDPVNIRNLLPQICHDHTRSVIIISDHTTLSDPQIL